MAITQNPVINNTNFAGKVSQAILMQAVFSGKMAQYMTGIGGIRSKISLRMLEVASDIRAYDELFGAITPNADYSEKVLQPVLADCRFKMGNEALRTVWGVDDMRGGSAAGTLQPQILSMIIQQIIKDNQFKRDQMILLGDTASLTPHLALQDGFFKLWTADANVKSVGTGALTAVNLKANIDLMFLEMKGREWGESATDVFLFMNPQDMQLAKSLRGDDETRLLNAVQNPVNNSLTIDYLYESYYKVVESAAIPRGVMFLTRKSNLILGYDVLGEESNFNIVDHYGNSNDDYITGRAKFYLGWQYAYSNEVITYGLKAAN